MSWLRGKKTIIGGSLVMLGAVLAVTFGHLVPELGVMVFGVGASIAGYGDKANRHQAELLAALTELQQVGVDMRTKNAVVAISGLAGAADVLTPAVADELLRRASIQQRTEQPR